MMCTRLSCLCCFLLVLAAPVLSASSSDKANASAALAHPQPESTGVDPNQDKQSAMTLFKEPNGWLMRMLREFFNDINWQAIAAASEQVEKFVRRVDAILKAFRPAKKTGEDEPAPDGSRLLGSWWNSSAGPSPMAASWTPKLDTTKMDDSTNVKEMLQRVACYVGYMRILNNSQQALAELDAAKLVSNLFSGSKPSSFWSSWFG